MLRKLQLTVLLVIVFVLGYSVYGFLPNPPQIIPVALGSYIQDFFINHTTGNIPFVVVPQCHDATEIIRTMNATWPKHSMSQVAFMSTTTPGNTEQPVEQTGVSVTDGTGAIKWRYQRNEPYTGYPLLGNWTMYFFNEQNETSIEKITGQIPQFTTKMEQAGFTFSEPNNIPFYRYPAGNAAQKIGFTKNGYIYHFTFLEEDTPLVTGQGAQIDIAMNCTKEDPFLRTVYEKYLSLKYNLPSEATIFFSEKQDKVLQFTILYPGGVWNQTALEYYLDTDSEFVPLLSTDNFLSCSLLENRRIGKGLSCYRPEKKEFSIVTY